MSKDYRERCIEAKGDNCILCPSKLPVVVHHIDGDRDNGSLDNLIPVCRSCHAKIHRGSSGFEEWSEQIPDTARSDIPTGGTEGMRPSMAISHQLNGRIRDYAARNDLTAEEAYKRVIERGIGELENE